MDNALTTGNLAAEAGVNLETVRYYERRGLLRKPPRTEAGYRQYNEDDLRRLLFIKQAQELGFTLGEVKQLLSLRLDGRRSCEKVQSIAESKVRTIDQKITDLKRLRATLKKLVKDCDSNTTTNACPILDSIERGGGS